MALKATTLFLIIFSFFFYPNVFFFSLLDESISLNETHREDPLKLKRQQQSMEDDNPMMPSHEGQYRNFQPNSPEIVEISEESKSVAISRDRSGVFSDVYVAVGKDDLYVVKWALDHAVSQGSRVFLIHVYAPLSYIPTPVGKLSRSQLSKDQVQIYIREENNKTKHLLDKYIRLCNESNVMVETMLVESNATTKAILELIHVANVTNLVMGRTKQSQYFSRLKGLGKGEYVKKHAPDFCEVTIVYDKKKTKDRNSEKVDAPNGATSSTQRPHRSVNGHYERNFFDCVCLSKKFD